MNKEDYVSLEVAKMLKEKEFDYATLYYYEKNGKLGMMNLDAQSQMRKHGYMNDIYPRPTLYEAAKWLRKEYLFNIIINGIYVCPENEVEECVDEQRYWKFTIYKDTNFEFEKIYTSKCCYDTYEEALNNGILKSLEII